VLQRNNNHTRKIGEKNSTLNNHDGLNFFHFELSEKSHEIILPIEEETPWEMMHDIVWDPARGD